MVSEDGNVSDLWHRRLGHPSESVMKNMVGKVAMDSKIPKEVKLSFCESCVEGKMQRKPFKPTGEIRSTRKLQCVHSDVCGPMPTVHWRETLLCNLH